MCYTLISNLSILKQKLAFSEVYIYTTLKNIILNIIRITMTIL